MSDKQLFFTASTGTKLRFPNYWRMFLKSLKVALDNTSFKVHLVFDGNTLLDDIPKDVNVIRYQHRMLHRFERSLRNNHLKWLDTCRSTYLKTEIPFIAHNLGFSNNVLYADIDCFLLQDFVIGYTGKPFWAGSAKNTDKTHFCPGLMIYHVGKMLEFDIEILDHIDKHLEGNNSFDFDDLNAIFPLGSYGLLPLEYNWKPVWGIDANIKVLHFAGAKPNSIEDKTRLPFVRHLIDPNPTAFNYYSDWFETL
jgi:hypothetical protein